MFAIMEGLNIFDCKINIYEEYDKLKIFFQFYREMIYVKIIDIVFILNRFGSFVEYFINCC